MPSQFTTVGFVGAGRMATALALGLTKAGYQVGSVSSRSAASAQALAQKVPGCQAITHPADVLKRCDVAFLTIPDDAMASMAGALPWRAGQAAVHCSGALSLDVLSAARDRGALVGALHSLQTFATQDASTYRLVGVTFAIEGDGDMGRWLEEAVRRLGGYSVSIAAQDRPLYHAAAVMSCGYVATLLESACALWEAMGFSREEAVKALLPLTRGTLDNVESQGARNAATGPIVRGDMGTVRGHLAALAARAPAVVPLYCQAGLDMVALAQERGSIGTEQARGMRQLLRSYLAQATNDLSGSERPQVAAALDRH
ncbi:MAG: DUF2520 domain-containing protein [Dehalococcoidia bacterium]|nr:DUF2520 domain-containing protein [Dehalococcoidia bacterium]